MIVGFLSHSLMNDAGGVGSMPIAAPPSATGKKKLWHEDITQDLRNHLVHKLYVPTKHCPNVLFLPFILMNLFIKNICTCSCKSSWVSQKGFQKNVCLKVPGCLVFSLLPWLNNSSFQTQYDCKHHVDQLQMADIPSNTKHFLEAVSYGYSS